MTTLCLGYTQDKESLHTEYKEFCLQVPSSIMYSPTMIQKMIDSGVLDKDYNSLVYQSIEIYCTNVFPKNIVAFMNAEIDGEIILGVNDFGEITGIPCIGTLNEKIVKNMLYDSLSKNILDYDEIHDHITIDIVKLGIDKKLLSNKNLDDLLHAYNSRIKMHNIRTKIYQDKKKEWVKKTTTYERKLHDIINTKTSRGELMEYIRKNCKDAMVRNYLVGILDTDDVIHIQDFDKDNPNTLFHWTCLFKDEKLADLLNARPEKPQTPIRIHPELIFNKIAPLRLRFIENNSNINFYIIRVKIKKYVSNNAVYYRQPYSNECYYKIRRLTNANEPFCSYF